MSNSAALALIVAADLLTWFGYLYTSKLMLALSAEIVTGVTRGIPIPMAWRRKMVEKWTYVVAAGVTCCAIVAAVNLKIASATSDEGVKTLAYIGVFIGALVAIGWALAAAMDVRYFQSVLRQAEAD